MKLNKPGMILFIISSFFSILLLEFILYFAGNIFQYSRENVFISKIGKGNESYDSERDYEVFEGRVNSGKKRIIWTIGDSFTNAGNVSSLESYPAYLFKSFQENGYDYSVINLGQCEDPTWGTYARLKKVLMESDEKPEVILFLVGSADPFYYLYSGVDPRTMTRKKQRFVRFGDESLYWLKNSRVYKLFRYISLSFEHRAQSLNGELLTNYDLNLLNEIYEEIKKRNHQEEISDSQWKSYYDRAYRILKNKNSYIDGLVSEFEFTSHEKFVYSALVTPQVRFFSSKLEYDKAVLKIMNFGLDFPFYFWDDQKGDPASLSAMINLLKFQSKYSAEDFQRYLSKVKNIIGDLSEKKFFLQVKLVIEGKRDFEKELHSARLEYWDKIVSLSKKHNFKIVLLNYGTSFSDANEMISIVSKKYNLDLIDNNTYFKNLPDEYNHQAIFSDDNHFQPMGYRLMSDHIFYYLKNKKIIQR